MILEKYKGFIKTSYILWVKRHRIFWHNRKLQTIYIPENAIIPIKLVNKRKKIILTFECTLKVKFLFEKDGKK